MPPSGTYVEYIETVHDEVSVEQVEALRAEIEGLPEHPKRAMYDRLMQRLATPTRRIRHRMWYVGPNTWRVSTDYIHDPAQYSDSVLTPEVTWTASPDSLQVAEPQSVPERFDITKHFAPAESALRKFVVGGLAPNGPLRFRPTRASVKGDHWNALAETTDGKRQFEYAGTVIGGEARVKTRSVTVAADRPDLVGLVYGFGSWAYSDHMGRSVAHRVEKRSSSGQVRSEIELVELRRIAGESQAVLRMPEGGQDVVRGEISVASVYDLRPGRNTVTTFQGGSEQTQALRFETTAPQPLLRWVAIVAVSVAAVILVALKLRYRSHKEAPG